MFEVQLMSPRHFHYPPVSGTGYTCIITFGLFPTNENSMEKNKIDLSTYRPLFISKHMIFLGLRQPAR